MKFKKFCQLICAGLLSSSMLFTGMAEAAGNGDVNGDGQITQVDADLLLKYIRGENVSINKKNADVNGDGQISIADVQRILNKIRNNKKSTNIKGDVNNDGKVDQSDVDLLRQFIMRQVPESRIDKNNSDIDNDGTISLADFSEVMHFANQQNQKATLKVAYPANGLYSLQPMCAPNKELTVENASTNGGANAFIWSTNSNWHTQPSHQKWYVERIGNSEWYTIKAENSGLALNVEGGNGRDGTNVSVWAKTDENQTFRFYDAGNEYYIIQGHTHDDKLFVLDVAAARNQDGTNVHIWHYNQGAPEQKWKLEKRIPSSQPIVNDNIVAPLRNMYCTWRSYSNMSWGSYNQNSSGRNYHLGIDVRGDTDNVQAMAAGRVVVASNSNSGANGRRVVIEHKIGGKTCYSFYAHLKSVKVSKGQTVAAGQEIAVLGGSAYGKENYYGKHLHFAIVDTLWSSGDYYGYATKFSGNKVSFKDVIYYYPKYVLDNKRLP